MQDEFGPLAGIRVLELGSMLAGPFVGAMLADFGADVIKVEKPGKPDALREWPPHKNEIPLWWKTLARNKRTMSLDISSSEGREIATTLIAQSDIVIENFRPGTLERWGLSPNELRVSYPQTVWVRVSGWGQTGPNSDQGGYATIAEAFSGLASMTGYDDRGPMVSSFPMGDYLAGVFGAFGALAALRKRDKDGVGQIVDVALYEPLLRIIESAVVRQDQMGKGKPRLGNQMEEDVPRNIYQTSDEKWVAISCGSQSIFEGLADAMNKPNLKTDSRFLTMSDRVANRVPIDEEVANWVKALTADEVMKSLIEHKVVAGEVKEMSSVLNDPHVLARKAIQIVEDNVLGPLKMPAPVPQLSDTPGRIRWAGRDPGADTVSVLLNELGLTASEVETLQRNKIV